MSKQPEKPSSRSEGSGREYGHKAELGKDGSKTGRTVSYTRDRTTGRITSQVIHTHFKPD